MIRKARPLNLLCSIYSQALLNDNTLCQAACITRARPGSPRASWHACALAASLPSLCSPAMLSALLNDMLRRPLRAELQGMCHWVRTAFNSGSLELLHIQLCTAVHIARLTVFSQNMTGAPEEVDTQLDIPGRHVLGPLLTS